MKNQNISPELKELITEKNGACVSMIIPLDELPSHFKINEIVTKQAYEKLEEQLQASVDPDTGEFLKNKLTSLKNQVSRNAGIKGIGIFLSEKISTIMTFPFEVKEKIIVSNSFEIRDMVQNEHYLKEYCVMSITKEKISLYKGFGGRLIEVNDKNFPIESVAAEYEIPAVKNQVNDASQAMQRHMSTTTQSKAEAYNIISKKLLDYVDQKKPLILAGAEKEVAEAEHLLTHINVAGKVHGSYDDYNFNELEDKAWESFLVHIKKNERELLHTINETAPHLLSSGIQTVWLDAKMGKGKLLVVEKDLAIPGYVEKDEFALLLSPTAKSKKIPDAVDDVVETVLEMNGKVIFVDNGLLKQHNGIVMIDRFS
jgi:hypothetical protein